MTYEIRNLIDSLNKNGIHVIANKQFDAFAFDFSEHDKMVAEEKDAFLPEMRKNFLEVGRKKDAQIAELDHMRKSWMETAQKWAVLNKELQDRIDKHEQDAIYLVELEDRHQSDCVEIKRLHTALEVMTEKYMKLREVHGL